MTENRAHPERWSDEEEVFCRLCGDSIWQSGDGWIHDDGPVDDHWAEPVIP